MLIPGACAARLRDHAVPESPARRLLQEALGRRAPILCSVICDRSLGEELMNIAATYSSEDMTTVAVACQKAFGLSDRNKDS